MPIPQHPYDNGFAVEFQIIMKLGILMFAKNRSSYAFNLIGCLIQNIYSGSILFQLSASSVTIVNTSSSLSTSFSVK